MELKKEVVKFTVIRELSFPFIILLDAKRPEMEVSSSGEVQEADDISQTADKNLGKENDQVHDTESSDSEESDNDEENSHVVSEKENKLIIVENDLEIQEL